ncbi:MAG: DUF4390 domain-containing protein [Rhodocyclaceae bacterium]|nr:DUF4390 domain-containing protein [Rhodocyclaceae bacterium]
MPNMMASTTPCCARRHKRPALLRLLPWSLVLWLFLPPAALAQDAEVRYAEIVADGGNYVINADIALTLNPAVANAIERGVPIHFVAEAAIESPRWYWFDETVVSRVLAYRLTYHPLTRSYRLGTGSLHQTFDALDDAVLTLSRIRHWIITPMRTLTPGESYNVSLRFRLDTTQLPTPFQVSTLGSSDWQIETEWMRWTFLASPLASQ